MRYLNYLKILNNYILYSIFFVLFSNYAQCQEKDIEVINSDELLIEKNGEETVRKLIGNVELRHDSTTLLCDSAYIYMTKKQVEAMSRVKAYTPKSVKMDCDKLIYDGNTKILELYDNIKLVQNNSTLITNRLTYFRIENKAVYIEGGKLQQSNSELKSNKGIYYSDKDSSEFLGDVVQKTQDYLLKSEILYYNTVKKIAYFNSPTRIITNDQKKLYTEKGWYQSVQKKAYLYQNPSYVDNEYELKSDTIYYDDSLKKGWGHCNVVLKSTDKTYSSGGDAINFDKLKRKTILTQTPYFFYTGKNDSLLIFSDTLIATDDSINKDRKLIAYRNVKANMNKSQAIADSLIYDREDSLLKFFKNPVLWSDNQQISGDTILIWLKKGEIDSLKVIENAMAVSKEDSMFYNQLKGKYLFAKFNIKNQAEYLIVRGNAESIYLMKDGKKYIGLNKSNSKDLEMLLEENKPSKVKFSQKPQATFYPIHQVWLAPLKLEGFRLLNNLRPLKYF